MKMKKGITLGMLGMGALAFGENKTTAEKVNFSVKPRLSGGKCTADVKGIKEAEGKKLTGFKCQVAEKDKELFEKSGLSKMKTIVIYNKETQKEILDVLGKMKEEDNRFRFDVNYIIQQGLAKDSQPKKPVASKNNATSSSQLKKEVNPATGKPVAKPATEEKKLRPRVQDKILNKKQGNDKDFVLDIGAFDSKLKCFVPANKVGEILKHEGRYIFVDCHRKMGKEMLKGFSNRIEITDKDLRKEMVDFIRYYHNEHTKAGARYIDEGDVPTAKEIKDADYDEIPILVVPYPTPYKASLKNLAEKPADDEITKVLQKYQRKYASL